MVAIGRIAKGVGRLLFDPKFTDVATETLKASRKASGFKNYHKQIKDAFVKANKESSKTSLWEGMWKSVKTLPGDISSTIKGTSGLWGKTKGVFSQLGKRMPLIGALMMVGFELPNIISAFKDKGLIGGLCEVGKSSARLVGSMGGFVLGQALIPIPVVGGLIGAIAGDWLVSKVVGKSHSEKKAELEEATAQADTNEAAAQQLLMQQQINNMAQNPYAQVNQATTVPQMPKMTMTPQQIAAMGQMLAGGYGINGVMDQDFMAMNAGLGNNFNYLC